MDLIKESDSILDRLPLLVCRLSSDGVIKHVNPYTIKMTGYSQDELEGENWWDLFYPGAYREQVGHLYAELREKDVVDYQMVMVDKHNHEHVIKWTSVSSRDEEGNLDEILGMGLDISEKVQLEKAAERERLAFAKILNISPIALAIVEPNGRISYVNKQATEVLGLSKEEITKREYNASSWQITSFEGEDFPDSQLPVARVLDEKDTVYDVQFAFHLPSGERRYLSMNAAPFFNSRGEVEKVVTSFQDISKRELAVKFANRTMRALRVTNAGLRAIMGSDNLQEILDSICEIAINAGGYEIAWFGVALNDESKTVKPIAVCGNESSYLEDIQITWRDSEFGQGPTGQAIRQMKPIIARDIEHEETFRPWRERALEKGFSSSMSVPFFLDEDSIATFNIYSDEKDAFDEQEVLLVKKLVESLEFALEANRHRVQHKKAREDLEKVSTQAFLYMDVMGHDLRNQLQSVMLSLDLLATEFPEIEESVHIDTINLQLDRATRLIQKAATLNKVLNAGIEKKALSTFLEKTISKIREDYPSLEIEYEDPSTDIKIKANEFLETAFYDILENAVEHNPREKKKAWIKVEEQKKYCIVRIADNGQGVPDDLKGSLFDHKRRFGGLGLHLVANILESYGGSIEVGNRIPRAPREGAEFVMKIPLAE